jgi:DNA-binding HxlR family transcriptional regulator
MTEHCPVTGIAHVIGKKWAIPILEEVALREFRGFNDFLAKAEMTPRTLSAELKELESSGIIRRTEGGENDIHTRYFLTAKGKELRRIIAELKMWSVK